MAYQGLDQRDRDWIGALRSALDACALPSTLDEALRPIERGLQANLFTLENGSIQDARTTISQTRRAWRHGTNWGDGRTDPPEKLRTLGLVAPTYASTDAMAEEMALTAYSYTMDRPQIYKLINKMLSNRTGRAEGAGAQVRISAAMRSLLPYIKLLEHALSQLGHVSANFVCGGPASAAAPSSKCFRGITHVYPGYPGNPNGSQVHDPPSYFVPGSRMCWYAFTSTTRDITATINFMNGPTSGSNGPYGPATIFEVAIARGYCVEALSHYAGENEVLLPMLSEFEVVYTSSKMAIPAQEQGVAGVWLDVSPPMDYPDTHGRAPNGRPLYERAFSHDSVNLRQLIPGMRTASEQKAVDADRVAAEVEGLKVSLAKEREALEKMAGSFHEDECGPEVSASSSTSAPSPSPLVNSPVRVHGLDAKGGFRDLNGRVAFCLEWDAQAQRASVAVPGINQPVQLRADNLERLTPHLLSTLRLNVSADQPFTLNSLRVAFHTTAKEPGFMANAVDAYMRLSGASFASPEAASILHDAVQLEKLRADPKTAKKAEAKSGGWSGSCQASCASDGQTSPIQCTANYLSAAEANGAVTFADSFAPFELTDELTSLTLCIVLASDSTSISLLTKARQSMSKPTANTACSFMCLGDDEGGASGVAVDVSDAASGAMPDARAGIFLYASPFDAFARALPLGGRARILLVNVTRSALPKLETVPPFSLPNGAAIYRRYLPLAALAGQERVRMQALKAIVPNDDKWVTLERCERGKRLGVPTAELHLLLFRSMYRVDEWVLEAEGGADEGRGEKKKSD